MLSQLEHSSQPFRLNDLPEELIMKIFENFDGSDQITSSNRQVRSKQPCKYRTGFPRSAETYKPDLKNLCLTSRPMYKIARQLTVRSIVDNGCESTRQTWITRFIRDPDAAASVRVLYLNHEGLILRESTTQAAGIRTVQEPRQAIEAVNIESKKKERRFEKSWQ